MVKRASWMRALVHGHSDWHSATPCTDAPMTRSHDSSVRQRQQGRDAAQLARRRGAERARGGRRLRRRPARRASPCTRAPTGGTSRRTTCATIARALRERAPARRVQHRRRSAARPARLWSTRCGRTSARWCRSCPARSRARPGGSPGRRPSGCRTSIARLHGARHPRQPVRRCRRPSRSAGRRRSAPTASSCTPSRSRARSSAARTGRARRSRATRDAARLAHSLGLGVNAGHDLDLDNLVLFRELPYLDEVSIGHAIMSRALFVGLSTVVREYLEVLAGARR